MNDNALVEHAKRELDLIGMAESDDDLNNAMRRQILKVCEIFADEDHYKHTAEITVKILSQLLRGKPLTPLTGEDDEWIDLTEDNKGLPFYRNKRYKRIYKNSTEVWQNDAVVFWEWIETESGEKVKEFYITGDSKKIITDFPYMPTQEYKEFVRVTPA